MFTQDRNQPLPEGQRFQAASFTVASIQEGNPDLNPETSRNLTLGGDFRLFDLMGIDDRYGSLTATVNYINIKFENRIEVIAAADRLRQPECHITENAIDDPRGRHPNIWELIPVNPEVDQFGVPLQVGSCFAFADPFVPGVQNLVTTVYGTSENFSEVNTQALDLNLDYGIDTRFGYVAVAPRMTYLLEFSSQRAPGDPVIEAAGTFGAPGPGVASVMPRVRASIPISLQRDNHTIMLTHRYISSVSNPSNTAKIDAAHTWNLNYTWSANNGLRVGAFVDNLTGEVDLDPASQNLLPAFKRRLGVQMSYDF